MSGAEPDLNRRRAGVCLHLTSLPGPRGIGEIGAAALDFMDWMRAHGLSVWQFLPMGPTGYGNSPYQLLSIFAGNPLLIDLGALAEWGLLEPGELHAYPESRPGRIDYARVIAAKSPLLARAAERFLAHADSGLLGEYESFCADNNARWLDDFAAFALLKSANGEAAWTEWRADQRRHRPALAAELARSTPEHWHRAKLIQFFFARQWSELRAAAASRGIVLFGDMPIYLAHDSAEAWSKRELLEVDADGVPLEVAGVPPDYFSAHGQLWGNPLYRWSAHEADGFGWWIARLEHALGRADMVRLDHFRGFDAYWAVPRGAATAHEGQWKQGPGRALFDALETALGRVPIVAEDLGLITESVTALRKAYALPGMQVLQFLVDQAEFELDGIEEDCVCYTGTHDNDTTEGWFAGSGRLSGNALARFRSAVIRNVENAESSIHKALISLCFKCKARFAIAPLQDFLGLGSEARLNTPGESEGNWRWRVVEAELAEADCGYVNDLVRETGRR